MDEMSFRPLTGMVQYTSGRKVNFHRFRPLTGMVLEQSGN